MPSHSIDIFFSSDTELSEWEAINKEWRNDVYVFYNDFMFQLNIYTPVRLLQDFETEIKDYGFYSVDENIVLVQSTDKKTIISSLLKLYDEGYFNKIKPLNKNNDVSLIKVY
jgi:predicted PilT family ATPase